METFLIQKMLPIYSLQIVPFLILTGLHVHQNSEETLC